MKRIFSVIAAAWLLVGQAFAAEQSSYVFPTVAPVSGGKDFGSIIANYINPGIRALASCNNGPTAPANGPSGAPLFFQCWADTSASPTINLKYWDGAAWATLATLDASAHSFSLLSSSTIRNVTGTSDTILDADRGKLIDVANASSVAQALPRAGVSSSFLAGWYATIRNSGAGTITLTPTTSTIDGAATLTIRPGQTYSIRSDGTNYKSSMPQQPYHANLAALAALTAATDKCFYFSSSSALATFDCPSWARTVISAADLTAGRLAFGLAIGSDVQAYHANLAALSGLTGAAGKFSYFTGPGASALTDSTSFGRSVLNVADASALRTLGAVVIGTNVQAWDADLDCVAALSSAGLIARTGSGTCAVRTITAPAAGISFTNGDGVSGNPTLALANDLAALEALSSTGIARRTGTDAWSVGTLVANSELADMATARFKGRTTAGTGAPEDLTATQATAILNPCVGDSGSGGTKGLVTAPGAGDASAGKFLKADCSWAVPSGGGGGSGATDTERQNSLLGLIYQSKTFAGYRRLVNIFADGYKASDGINSGSSTNYTADTTGGKVSPSGSTVATLPAQTFTSNNAGWSGYGARQLIPASAVTTSGTLVSVTFTGPTSGNPTVISAAYIGPSGTAPSFASTPVQLTYLGSGSFTIPVGGTLTTDVVTYSLNEAVDQIISLGVTSGDFRTATSGVSGFTRYYKAAASAEASNPSVSGYSNSANELQVVTSISVVSGFNNMTVVTATQTADASVSNGRVLVEYDNTATPTLNTDLTVEITCNGGSNWASATLSAVTSYSQAGRKVAETADTPCTSGTSWAARIKTFNNKNIPIYGATLTVH